MKILYDLNEENKNLALALGFFDGVHLGHQEVIKSAVNYAKENNTKSAVITFKEHPQVVLQGVKPAYISTIAHKHERLEALGIDYCYELDFSKVCNLSGEDYIKNFLIKNFAPISISTGFNHFFGSGKSGSAQLLAEKANEFNYKYFMTAPIKLNEEVVSSSIIRKKIIATDFESVEKMLGEKYTISGTVQKGASLARKIGFKTANIIYPQKNIQLPFGVYQVEISLQNETYTGIANFGIKPTFQNLVEQPILEVHILNFDKNIYNESIDVKFIKFIRKEIKFNSAQDLIKQINRDMNQIST